jgi:outer membrane protein
MKPIRPVLMFGGCVAVLIASGCVNQRKEVETYRKVVDGGGNGAAAKFQYEPGSPLTLEQALVLANRGYEQIDIQGEAYLQTLIEKDRAYSTFMPTVSLSPELSWQNKRSSRGTVITGGGTTTGATGGTGTGTGGTGTGTTTAVGSSGTFTTFDSPIVTKANLFNGFRDVATIRGAYANIDQFRNLLLDLRLTVLLETAQAYYQVLLAERSVEVLTNSVKFQDARVLDMQGRLRAGIAQPLDLAQTEATAASTRAQLVTAQDNVNTSRLTLALMTNADVDRAPLVDRLYVPAQLPNADQEVLIADENRPDLRADEAAVRVARENVQVAIGQWYPSVSLNLDYYLHKDSFPTTVEWTSILSLNLPIFSAGTIYADVRTAWSKLRAAVYQEWLLIRTIKRDVKSAWVTVDDSRRRIAELETEVAASQEALKQSTQRYSVGLATNLDVLTAQDTLLASQLALATEQFNRKIFYLDLLRATGQLGLPAEADSLSAGPTSRPTAEQTRPIVPGYDIPPMRLPGMPTQPTTAPSTQLTTMPAGQ